MTLVSLIVYLFESLTYILYFIFLIMDTFLAISGE